MVKLKENKGFTLAELLIVVAIIGVLVAISIPIFTAQLRKGRLATNQANARSAYADVVAQIILDGITDDTAYSYDIATATAEEYSTGNSPTLGIADKPIANWDVDSDSEGTKLGDKVAKKWKVHVANEGNQIGVSGFTPIFETS